MKKHFLRNETTDRVDKDTGEVISTTTSKLVTVSYSESDSFFMVFYRLMKSFYEIKYVKDVMVLVKFAELLDMNKSDIELTTKRRREICEELNINQPYLSNAIRRLKELGLIHGDKGEYCIDERVFWKGDRRVRMEYLKTRGLNYNIQFKTEERELKPIKNV